MSTEAAERTLSDEMHAVEQQCPGWHLWVSSAGRIWAVNVHPRTSACGCTLDAETPELMRHEIAVEEHRWAAVAA